MAAGNAAFGEEEEQKGLEGGRSRTTLCTHMFIHGYRHFYHCFYHITVLYWGREFCPVSMTSEKQPS